MQSCPLPGGAPPANERNQDAEFCRRLPGAGLGGLTGWTVDVIASWGPVGVGLWVAVKPVPADPQRGHLARRGIRGGLRSNVGMGRLAGRNPRIDPGCGCADWIGAMVGTERFRKIADRVPLMRASDIDKGVNWFTRFDPIAVLVGRFPSTPGRRRDETVSRRGAADLVGKPVDCRRDCTRLRRVGRGGHRPWRHGWTLPAAQRNRM